MTQHEQQQLLLEIPTVAAEAAEIPHYASSHAAGADVRAYLENPVILNPGESALIPTGLRVAIPEGYEIQVRPRSGLALKEQVTVLNTPGTIDADYRGEIGIILINHGKKPFTVTTGMRIAQLIVAPVVKALFVDSSALTLTKRGEGGFGHTGAH
jgi:dUTP pyrophosphatase